jgi:metal-dependent amidase/aminoacylase/carboxypeptidase family protein
VSPTTENETLDEKVRVAVAAERDYTNRVMEFVHAHPELGHQEHACARFLVECLRDSGLTVEQGWQGMRTAFRGELTGTERGRSVGLVMVYDAVPAHDSEGLLAPDHSCGHGPLAAGVVAAAKVLSRLRGEFAGTLVVLGCPADELHSPDTVDAGGGKARAAESGACDDLDAALYAHPEFIDAVWDQSRWMCREEAIVGGPRSLTAGNPQPAHEMVAVALSLSAEAPGDILIERITSDGDVEAGCRVVSRVTFLLFADSEQALEAATERAHACIPDAQWRTVGPPYRGIRPDAGVASAARAALEAAGREVVPDPPPLPFATDFGNITQRVPGALIGVGRPEGWQFHTTEGAREFQSPAGLESAVGIAEVLALTAIRLWRDD